MSEASICKTLRKEARGLELPGFVIVEATTVISGSVQIVNAGVKTHHSPEQKYTTVAA